MRARLTLVFLGVLLLRAQDSVVKVHEEQRTFPTYDEGAPDPNPQFDAFYRDIFPNYPYTLRTPINKKRSLTQWRVVVLENEYLSCRILPDLGGHLHGCTDKITGKEIFYANPVIRRSVESARGEFVAMGIESSFPMAHSRVTGSPVDFAWSLRDGVGRVVVGDTDRTTGMQWRVEFSLHPGSTVLEQRATVYNASPARRGYQWWVNAAVELDDPHLRIVYPVKWMLPHNTSEMTAWPTNAKGVDLSDVANHKTMLGLFGHLSREPWMAIYKPKFRSGVAHYADVSRLKGKKIWLWGETDSYVRESLTEHFNSYVEMQAGELETQPEFGFLLPIESKTYQHDWIPFHDLGGVSRVTPDAVLNLSRKGSSVTVELNATHVMKGVTLRLTEAGKTVWEGPVDLDPKVKYAQPVEAAKLTVDLLGSSGKLLLHHVEGEINATAFDRTAKNPEPVVPATNSDAPEDALARGAYNEQRDQWVFAWGDYDRALKLAPNDPRLLTAAGRAAIALNRYDDAIRLLKDVADKSAEAAYYYGVALATKADHLAEAQAALTAAQKSNTYAQAAQLQTALLAAREQGSAGLPEATRIVQSLAAKPGAVSQLGALEIALLRRSGKPADAKNRLRVWLAQDPSNDMLRFERVLNGGADDAALWNHLAADPERVLSLAEEYRQIGDYEDAVQLLDRHYSPQPETEKEPGKALPQDHPLVVYLRGFCRLQMGQNASADFQRANTLSTQYVFPHQHIFRRVFAAALQQNANDAVAHDLLGDLYFDSFQVTEAIAEWKQALAIDKTLPALHRNLGRALLEYANDPEAAASVLREGQQLAPGDADIARALGSIHLAPARTAAPPPPSAPVSTTSATPAAPTGVVSIGSAPALVPADAKEIPKQDVAEIALIRSVREAGWSVGQFNAANFPKDKQPDSVKRAYVEVQLQQLLEQARANHCPEALEGLENLGDINQSFPFTYTKFAPFMKQAHFQYYMAVVQSMCGADKAAQKRWSKISQSSEPADSLDSVFPYWAAKRLGSSDAAQRVEAALQEANKMQMDDSRPDIAFVKGALLWAAGKTDEGAALLDKAAASPDPFVRYMSEALRVEAARK